MAPPLSTEVAFQKRSIIFSDVDGCLIGQSPTNFTQITEAIKRVPESFLVILTTGKTAHEVIQLNHYLSLPGPFIVEGGHGILFKYHVPSIFPASKWISLGDYSLFSLSEAKPDLSEIKLISPDNALLTEMEDDYLASLTGMSPEDVYFAKQRFFTEPIFIKNMTENELKILKKKLAHKKFYYSQSSRFLHVSKSSSNKGRAIKFLLKSIFSNQVDKTYAIGDSLNDFSMFAACDNNYYIANRLDDYLPKRCEVIMEKELSGWLRIMSEII